MSLSNRDDEMFAINDEKPNPVNTPRHTLGSRSWNGSKPSSSRTLRSLTQNHGCSKPQKLSKGKNLDEGRNRQVKLMLDTCALRTKLFYGLYLKSNLALLAHVMLSWAQKDNKCLIEASVSVKCSGKEQLNSVLLSHFMGEKVLHVPPYLHAI